MPYDPPPLVADAVVVQAGGHEALQKKLQPLLEDKNITDADATRWCALLGVRTSVQGAKYTKADKLKLVVLHKRLREQKRWLPAEFYKQRWFTLRQLVDELWLIFKGFMLAILLGVATMALSYGAFRAAEYYFDANDCKDFFKFTDTWCVAAENIRYQAHELVDDRVRIAIKGGIATLQGGATLFVTKWVARLAGRELHGE